MARQAADMGHGALLTNQVYPKVFSLCLEDGGNIIIDTAAAPQHVLTWTVAATMGCLFVPAINPQHKGLLTYPDPIRARLGQISGMELGRKNFRVNEVDTLPNGDLHFTTTPTTRTDPPIPREERHGTTLGPPMNDITTLQKRLHRSQLLYQLAQLELEREIEMDKRKNRNELNMRPQAPPNTPHADTKTSQRPPEELLCDLDTVKEDPPTPSFTPDTYILIRNADTASWIQLSTVTREELRI